MAVGIEKLIDITLLDYYDDKVRDWVVETLNEKTAGLELTKRETLPEVGEVGRLYIVEDAILTWNEEIQDYEPVGTGAEAKPTWGTF